MPFLDKQIDRESEKQRRLIERRFSQAAVEYDQHAEVQKWAADFLAMKIRQTVPSTIWVGPDFRGLELGCGTGFPVNSNN